MALAVPEVQPYRRMMVRAVRSLTVPGVVVTALRPVLVLLAVTPKDA